MQSWELSNYLGMLGVTAPTQLTDIPEAGQSEGKRTVDVLRGYRIRMACHRHTPQLLRWQFLVH